MRKFNKIEKQIKAQVDKSCGQAASAIFVSAVKIKPFRLSAHRIYFSIKITILVYFFSLQFPTVIVISKANIFHAIFIREWFYDVGVEGKSFHLLKLGRDDLEWLRRGGGRLHSVTMKWKAFQHLTTRRERERTELNSKGNSEHGAFQFYYRNV